MTTLFRRLSQFLKMNLVTRSVAGNPLSKRTELFKKIYYSREPFIQILHVNNSHWIVVSNMPFK